MKESYAIAVYELLLKGDAVDGVLTGLQKVLTTNGHTAIHSQILTRVISLLSHLKTAEATQIVVADQNDVQKLTQTITASLQKIGGTLENAIIKTDKTLVGGYVLTYKGRSLNASHKSKLIKLYRNITV